MKIDPDECDSEIQSFSSSSRLSSWELLVVSLISLVWNIYRDVVLKARVWANFGFDWVSRLFVLSAINFGPGIYTLRSPLLKCRRAFHRGVRIL
jgi:hypothetical protein